MQFGKKERKRTLDDEIGHILEALKNTAVGSEAYTIAVKNLEILYKARNERKISPNSWLLASGGIVEMLIIMAWEHSHIIPTKAFGILSRIIRF